MRTPFIVQTLGRKSKVLWKSLLRAQSYGLVRIAELSRRQNCMRLESQAFGFILLKGEFTIQIDR